MALTVCIVDDDVNNINTAGYILSKEGFDVLGFKSGKAFLKHIDKNGVPDLVLLDIKMPEMDGFETLAEFKQRPKAPEVPVIFLSADEREDSKERGMQLGAVGFLEKPFLPDVLVQSVRQNTGSRQ
ncbi:MAG: response regulator [Lachnospiraceae bacterium]|nr:response regulator [Lachnospiraceae bacterium]